MAALAYTALSGSRNSSISSTERSITTTTSGPADSSASVTKAWYGRALRSVARAGARPCSATARPTSTKLQAK